MKILHFISPMFGLFIVSNCNPNDNSQLDPSNTSPHKIENFITDEWKYNNTIWYSSELTLHANGTFTFHDQSCYGQNFSHGEWTNTRNSIFLTSFDAFRPKEEIKSNIKVESAKHKKEKYRSKKAEGLYSFEGIEDVPSIILHHANDTIPIYLDKAELQLKNDTLYCVDLKLPKGTKFHKIKIKS